MIKVLLADDLEIVRAFIDVLCTRKGGGVEVLALASDGQEAVNGLITLARCGSA